MLLAEILNELGRDLPRSEDRIGPLFDSGRELSAIVARLDQSLWPEKTVLARAWVGSLDR